MEAHHYCSHQSEEVRQCVIYDSGAADARLIGIPSLNPIQILPVYASPSKAGLSACNSMACLEQSWQSFPLGPGMHLVISNLHAMISILLQTRAVELT